MAEGRLMGILIPRLSSVLGMKKGAQRAEVGEQFHFLINVLDRSMVRKKECCLMLTLHF